MVKVLESNSRDLGSIAGSVNMVKYLNKYLNISFCQVSPSVK